MIFQKSKQHFTYGVLLGIQCSIPRLVLLPLERKDGGDQPEVSTWASGYGGMKELKFHISELNDRWITLAFTKQTSVPLGYDNLLLLTADFHWKGNGVLVLMENMEGEKKMWPRSMYDQKWLDEIRETLARLHHEEV